MDPEEITEEDVDEVTEEEIDESIKRARRKIEREEQRLEECYSGLDDPRCDIKSDEEIEEDLGRTYWDDEGVLRWENSDSVPPDDLLVQFIDDEETLRRCVRARAMDSRVSIARYKARQKNRTPEQKAAERRNARAAFGEGEKVVNVLTGESFTT